MIRSQQTASNASSLSSTLKSFSHYSSVGASPRPEQSMEERTLSMSKKDVHLRRFCAVSDIDFGVDFCVLGARDKALNNNLVCIVSLRSADWIGEWLKRQLPLRCTLYHPHILKIYDILVADGALSLVFEHHKGRNLLEFLTKYKPTESFVRNLFQQLIFALDYYHHQGIEGLDLSLERVSYNFESGILKVIDFGFCEGSSSTEQSYALPYVAPEQLQFPEPAFDPKVLAFAPSNHPFLQQAADVWRCGVLLYCMLFRVFPFCPDKSTTCKDHVQNIMQGRWRVPRGETLSAQGFDLLKRMLDPDPECRISLDAIKRHPWYRKELPEGVVDYTFLQRPADGLPEKAAAIRCLWNAVADRQSSLCLK